MQAGETAGRLATRAEHGRFFAPSAPIHRTLVTMPRGVIVPLRPDGTPFAAAGGASASILGKDVDVASLWSSTNPKPSPGQVRIFYGQGPSKDVTLALVGTGKTENLTTDQLRERSRVVAATGVKALREVGCTEVS